MALKKEIEISKPFDTIITKYPDGTIAVKKLNFTAFKKVSGYECITDEERLAEKYDRQYKKTETYSDFVAQWADAKRSREIELQGGFLDIASAEKPAFAKSAFESISDDARKKSAEEKRRAKVLYNIAKTRNKIFDIARSNDFNYFVTLTFNSECCDRYSFSACSSKVRKYLNNFRSLHKDTCPNFKYLLVHEQHKDGAYHYHGLIYLEDDSLLTYDNVRSNQYKRRYHKDLPIYNWSNWHNGFSTVSKIQDQAACRSYILKYISKNIDDDYQKGQRHFYYSQNCLKPVKESVVSNKQLLLLLNQVYKTDKSIGYESTVDEINDYINMIADYQYGIDL
ncbi:rolling circle replication-associated protein [Longicatena caecimuris]|uniref:Bacteriophage replication gene A protein n=1 Tax=Longicatena caecimuris TaxID=1796635 RepID=A0A4R3TNX3_9FIRM|nr:hypothetical protein [Longicatena caecimuris]MCR1868961.1 hypothetical protein [Longicatena caecimuris]MCR1868970.1 hypothetical protein [Longicatena caecimuris]MCU0101451.1 hypothetical protein [Longicatena caecimuris]MCU0101460.1 hypothetical protein [Longicatena caecimuris]TCU63494.1 bacteriophage replication gene A protein [Longicatena caecimuris]